MVQSRWGKGGQIVIPVKARKVLNIKPGDQLIAISGPPGYREIVSFIPVEFLSAFLQHIEKHLSVLKKEVSQKKPK